MAASAFGVERQHVNYYVRKLTSSGIERSEFSSAALASPLPLTQTFNETEGADQWSTYCNAYVFAHGLVSSGMGRKKAAHLTSEKFGISFSASSARNAGRSDGQPPRAKGRQVFIPREVEVQLEDLCLLLREMKLPIFRYMIMNYVNVLIEGTEVAEQFKDGQVKRNWYYRWLGRCTRLTTANLTPLEMTRAM